MAPSPLSTALFITPALFTVQQIPEPVSAPIIPSVVPALVNANAARTPIAPSTIVPSIPSSSSSFVNNWKSMSLVPSKQSTTALRSVLPSSDVNFPEFQQGPPSLTGTVTSGTDSTASVSSSTSVSPTQDLVDVAAAHHKSLRQLLQVEDDGKTPLTNAPKVIGHRGAIYQDLENTRSGFNLCAEIGCNAVELDVFLLKCGNLIVFHGGGTDENPGFLREYCNHPGTILDLTYKEALDLSFNPDFAEFPCPSSKVLTGKIPTLEDVLLDAKKTGLNIKIELKGVGTTKPTLDLVDRLDMVDQCSFSSFDHERIRLVRELRPQTNPATGEYVYRTGALFNGLPDNFIEQAQDVGASEIHLRYDTCTKPVVDSIHAAGFRSLAWFRGPIGMDQDCREKYWDVGNEDDSMYRVVWQTGVEQLCLNKPNVMLNLRERMMAAVTTAN